MLDGMPVEPQVLSKGSEDAYVEEDAEVEAAPSAVSRSSKVGVMPKGSFEASFRLSKASESELVWRTSMEAWKQQLAEEEVEDDRTVEEGGDGLLYADRPEGQH